MEKALQITISGQLEHVLPVAVVGLERIPKGFPTACLRESAGTILQNDLRTWEVNRKKRDFLGKQGCLSKAYHAGSKKASMIVKGRIVNQKRWFVFGPGMITFKYRLQRMELNKNECMQTCYNGSVNQPGSHTNNRRRSGFFFCQRYRRQGGKRIMP
jgi:hypothetical protein